MQTWPLTVSRYTKPARQDFLPSSHMPSFLPPGQGSSPVLYTSCPGKSSFLPATYTLLPSSRPWLISVYLLFGKPSFFPATCLPFFLPAMAHILVPVSSRKEGTGGKWREGDRLQVEEGGKRMGSGGRKTVRKCKEGRGWKIEGRRKGSVKRGKRVGSGGRREMEEKWRKEGDGWKVEEGERRIHCQKCWV